MRLQLLTKECVRLGLMKGCECVLVNIVFADEEAAPCEVVAGDPVTLQYMPATLTLREADAPWALPGVSCPKVSPGVSNRGLFHLSPSTAYIRRIVEKDHYISVRRTQFAVMPADTRIVYAVQGATFQAVIAEMVRPPHMDWSTHWLACYVMLSRATSLEGLLVLRQAGRQELGHRPPAYLVDEIDRLLALEKTTTEGLRASLEQLPTAFSPPKFRRSSNLGRRQRSAAE